MHDSQFGNNLISAGQMMSLSTIKKTHTGIMGPHNHNCNADKKVNNLDRHGETVMPVHECHCSLL